MTSVVAKQRSFALLRIGFGLVWVILAVFKWQPDFLHNFTGYLTDALAGQPPAVHAWIQLWITIVSTHPYAFAVLTAALETAVAVSLVFGICTRVGIITGSALCLLIWSTAEGFGGPYMAGSTDIGGAVMCVFIFIALWIGESWQAYSFDAYFAKGRPVDPAPRDDRHERVVMVLLVVIVILAGFLITNMLPTQTQLTVQANPQMAGMGAMPAGMMLKVYGLAPSDPVPTVDFTITKDPGSGWNLHIVTTNFTFTPENVNMAAVADQGHAHLYVDGALFVVYSPWYHFNDLSPGTHDIVVTLNANDHSVFAEKGAYIKREQTITQP